MKNSESKLETVERFFSGTGRSYDRMVAVTTFGQDKVWKERINGQIPADARRVLDLACGTGISTFALARHLPHAEIVGVDLRDEYLDLARAKAAALGARNLTFATSAAEEYVPDGTFDAVSASYLAKYAALDRLAPMVFGALNPGGIWVMHDFIPPATPQARFLMRIHFWVLRNIAGLVLPSWRDAMTDLPEIIAASDWRNRLEAEMRAAGFEDIRHIRLAKYGAALVTARKPA